MIVPAVTNVIPPKSMMIPPIMLRIAIIGTPVGRDLGITVSQKDVPFYSIDREAVLC